MYNKHTYHNTETTPPEMNINKLLNKKLIIITGKGGVGKTTISLAIALLNSTHNKRSIIATVNNIEKETPFFGLNKEIGYYETKLFNNVNATAIQPDRALNEYIKEKFMKLFPLYKTMFKAGTLRNFFLAAPGLKELITIGKVWQLGNIKSGKSRKFKYDQVIFDAPSTGHALPILDLPKRILGMVRGGNLKTHVEWVEEFLKNPDQTALVTVTIPEEIAVKETINLVEATKLMGIKHLFTVVNCMYPEIFDVGEEKKIESLIKEKRVDQLIPTLKLAKSHIERVKIQKARVGELSENIKEKLVFVPFKFGNDLTSQDLERFSNEIENQLL